MATDIIQVDYELLEEIGRRFSIQAEETAHLYTQITRQVINLQHGKWVGRGANSFYLEMEDDALPALKRLQNAFLQSEHIVYQLIELYQNAEELAASGLQFGVSGAYPPNGGAPPYANYNDLPNEPSLVLGPQATHQDLAAAVEQMYRINNVRDGKEYGIDEPIRIVKTGPNDYLVMVMGTDADDAHAGSNDWPSNLSSGRNVPSRYQLYVKEAIKDNIPAGATINLVGHSQGGHVVMNLAGTQDLVDKYHIANVISYGSSGSAPYNPRIGAENYHNFLLADDPLRAIEVPSHRAPFLSIPDKEIIGLPGIGNSPSIDPQLIMETGGHGGYHHSDYLAQQKLPFQISEWRVVNSIPANQIPLDNSRLAWDDVQNGWRNRDWLQITRGGVDLGFHEGAVTIVGSSQNIVNTFTQYMPESAQVFVDRQFDRFGEQVAMMPRFTDMAGDVAGDVAGSAFNFFFGD